MICSVYSLVYHLLHHPHTYTQLSNSLVSFHFCSASCLLHVVKNCPQLPVTLAADLCSNRQALWMCGIFRFGFFDRLWSGGAPVLFAVYRYHAGHQGLKEQVKFIAIIQFSRLPLESTLTSTAMKCSHLNNVVSYTQEQHSEILGT